MSTTSEPIIYERDIAESFLREAVEHKIARLGSSQSLGIEDFTTWIEKAFAPIGTSKNHKVYEEPFGIEEMYALLDHFIRERTVGSLSGPREESLAVLVEATRDVIRDHYGNAPRPTPPQAQPAASKGKKQKQAGPEPVADPANSSPPIAMASEVDTQGTLAAPVPELGTKDAAKREFFKISGRIDELLGKPWCREAGYRSVTCALTTDTPELFRRTCMELQGSSMAGGEITTLFRQLCVLQAAHAAAPEQSQDISPA